MSEAKKREFSIPRFNDYKRQAEEYDTHFINQTKRKQAAQNTNADDDLPTISIITSIFNGETHIANAINSIAQQNYTKLEYIVVDGASQDKSLEIIKKKQDEIDIWISEKDAGIYEGMNRGLALASGDYIGILNCDDRLKANAVKNIANSIANEAEKNAPADIFYGAIEYRMKDGELVFSGEKYPANKMFSFQTLAHHTSAFIKKTCYDELGLYTLDLKLASDMEFFRRALKNNKKFCYTNEVIGTMFSGGQSYTNMQLLRAETKKIMRAYQAPAFDYARFQLYETKDILARKFPLLGKIRRALL